jgi:hypothetical protein
MIRYGVYLASQLLSLRRFGGSEEGTEAAGAASVFVLTAVT